MGVILSIMVYVCTFAISAIIVQYGYRRQSRALQFIGLLPPIVLGAIRYDVGLDYMSYFNAYADITNPQVTYRYEATPNLELTFRVIAQASHLFFSSPVPMFLTYCAVTVFAFYSALRLIQPRNVGYALFFFYSIFYLNSFNIMRQGAAMSIGALAIVYYSKGMKRKALLFVILAALFHMSALLLLIFLLLEYMYEKRYLVRKKLKSFSSLFIKTLILSIVIAIGGLSVSAIGNFVYDNTGRIGTFDTNVSSGIIFKYTLSLACLYITIYAWKKFHDTQKKLTLFVALGTIVYSLGIVHNESARIGMYLIVLTPILVAVTYDYLSIKYFKSKFFATVGITCLSVVYIISVHLGGGDGVRYNYQNIFDSSEYSQQVKELQ